MCVICYTKIGLKTPRDSTRIEAQIPAVESKSMKKSYALLIIAALFAACFVPTSTCNAGPKKKATPPPEYHTVISSVSADSITVQEPKASKTYKIDQFTAIYYNGQSAKVTDLKTGMRVEVSAGGDPTVAERISASDAIAKK